RPRRARRSGRCARGRRGGRGARLGAARPERDRIAGGNVLPADRRGAAMNRLVRAELIRLRTVRMTFWLLLTLVAVDALVVCFTVPVHHGPSADLSLDAPGLLARCVGIGLAISQPVAMVLGILCFTQELRFGTM